MTDTAIRAERLSKQYQIGKRLDRHATLRDQIAETLAAPTHWFRRNGHSASAPSGSDSIWALKDVSFEVKRGEVVGIIGRNGAGKSTLLKVLSRITEPTEGYVDIFGRVGSLLEVGTGFHPELTGRENIYLNGAILGMKRAEINRKFDEIVSFAEVEQFIDTPVKRYSSGMYVRLAFAVAAHLEPDILLVDEVLAVGDAAFQKKCLGRMGDVAREGRTVLFVSHNLNAIQRLCPYSILMQQGQIGAYQDTSQVIVRYLRDGSSATSPEVPIDLLSTRGRRGSGQARFVSMLYSSGEPKADCQFYSNGPADFQLCIASNAARNVTSLAVTFYDRYGTKLVNADTVSLGQPVVLSQGENQVRLHLDHLYLKPGTYVVGLWLANMGEALDWIESACEVEVIGLETRGEGTPVKLDGVVTCTFGLAYGERGTPKGRTLER